MLSTPRALPAATADESAWPTLAEASRPPAASRQLQPVGNADAAWDDDDDDEDGENDEHGGLTAAELGIPAAAENGTRKDAAHHAQVTKRSTKCKYRGLILGYDHMSELSIDQLSIQGKLPCQMIQRAAAAGQGIGADHPAVAV